MQRASATTVFALFLSVCIAHSQAQHVRLDAISSGGTKLTRVLDQMDVRHLWLAGNYVEWDTGIIVDHPVKGAGKQTHCSAFAAAAAQRLGVYLLRPPEHRQILLANAQYEWLENEGKEKGWRRVHSAVEAQNLANEGELVVVTFRAPDPKKPGHIAIVRPAEKTVHEIEKDGPQIIQAGQTNHVSTTVAEGFKHHPGAWSDGEHGVKFYAHAVEIK